MCGIAISIGCDDAEALVARTIAGLLHRGDVTDPLVSPAPRVAMCTRRLRIVDPDNAVQPQPSFDGGLLVALNGQIYNHVELRRELEALGVPFRTRSDTEVLANALRVWGAGALPRLAGMYAFVAYELGSGEFLAARDPFGVKPLYLIQVGGGHLFSSEIRPLLEAVPEGEVLLLPPGHLLTKQRLVPFRSAVDLRPVSAERSPQALDRLLAAAVEARTPTDLPVATLFSGGIDSTLIAHYARRIQPTAPGYFLGAPDAPDFPYAARYADRTGYDLRLAPLELGADGGLTLMDRVIHTVEAFEPEIVRASLCAWLLNERIHADGFRVTLCGEGADELFAGYAPLEHAFAEGEAVGREMREQCLAGMHRSSLQRVDRCAMRFAVETREPFLDPAVASYAMALTPGDLVGRRHSRPHGKLPLRELYDLYPDELPAEIRDRTKIAFNEGAGFDTGPQTSPWRTLAQSLIGEREFAEGVREFADYDLRSPEELLYLRTLAQTLDIARVPHLKGRSRIVAPREIAHRFAELIV